MRYPTLHFWGLCLCVLLLGVTVKAERPNIIMILVDDLGWRDVGSYGSELYETPAIDALARAGLSFSSAYASSPLCTPTRASILTGQTVGRLRITVPQGHIAKHNLNPQEVEFGAPGLPMASPETANRLPLDAITLSKLLKDAGYATAFMGKWHLGHAPYIPENYGFDHVIGGRAFPGPPPPGFFGPWNPKTTNMPVVEGNPNADDVLGDEAVRFIESADEPFFLALWFFNVHAPFDAYPELIAKYAPETEHTQYQKSAIMAAMIETLDRNVAKVVEVLDRLGLEENTLILFTSDNGGNMYDRPEGVNPTNNFPLRGGKGNNYEGGSRVPMIVKWPGKVAENQWTDTIAISYDFFPTLLEVAGVATPPDAVLDGVSLVDAFDGSVMPRPPITSMFGHTVFATGNIANVWVRDGDWKLLRFFHAGSNQTDRFELYDLSTDPGENVNLSHRYPDKVAELNDWLTMHLAESATLLPRRNPRYNPDLMQAGFKIRNGGYFVENGNKSKARITSNQDSISLLYTSSGQETGDHLQLNIITNCAVGATAGAGGMFGQPVSLLPDMKPRNVRIPLNRVVKNEPILLILDTEQPGRTQLSNVSLIFSEDE